MPAPFSAKQILRNIWREPLLRVILLVSLTIGFGLPGFSFFFLVPEFSEQFIENIEDEASRTASYMMVNIFPEGELAVPPERLAQINKQIALASDTMLLDKVKVFSPSGRIIYSTDPTDIGKINRKTYFNSIVRQGLIFTKVVQKDTATVEGRITAKDVAEVYIPVMTEQGFGGAFEIYYEITAKKTALAGLITASTRLSIGMSAMLSALTLLVLFRASKTSLYRQQAQQQLRQTNNNLEQRVKEQTYELEVTQKTSIEALAILAESYDANTGAHLQRIQSYVACLLEALQETAEYRDYFRQRPGYIAEVTLASLLHDIGKTAIPHDILSKPGELTESEFNIVKTHTEIAGVILGRANAAFAEYFGKDSYLAFAREIALHHHERWDGDGYPHQLQGGAIPLSARVVAIADVYDALRSQRPYKEPWPHHEAVVEIKRCRGSQFDPQLVDIFLANAESFAAISARQVATNDFTAQQLQSASLLLNQPPTLH